MFRGVLERLNHLYQYSSHIAAILRRLGNKMALRRASAAVQIACLGDTLPACLPAWLFAAGLYFHLNACYHLESSYHIMQHHQRHDRMLTTSNPTDTIWGGWI